MKKYTILDHRGKKTIVYAKDIAHALPYAKDSRKIKDKMSLSEINEAIDDIADKYDGFYSRTYDKVFKDLKAKYPTLTYEEVKQVIERYADNPSSANAQLRVAKKYFSDSIDDSKVRDIDASSLMTLFTKYGKPYDYVCKTRPKMSSGSKYLGQLVSYTLSPIGKYDVDKARNFVDFLNKKGYEASIFAPNIVVTLKQDRSSGLYNWGHERANQYDSKVKDVDLNIVDKLIAEEEKAVMDYKEALMADSDSFANSVYTHILDEELEHLRELRSLKEQSVSDGNIADKKLDDSIHDGLSEAKKLVEQAGFKVVRVYGTDNEPYITVDWSGSYSELRKKVSELKSKAKAIGYNDVYADDDDICFSKY